MKTLVSIVKCEDYFPERVGAAVKEAVDLIGGIEQFIQPGGRALLKPNLLSARSPDDAVSTHPAVIEAIIDLVKSAEGTCSVGDSPSIGAETPEGYMRLLRTTGMKDVLDRTGASPIRLDDFAFEHEVPDAGVFKRILLSKAVFDTDLLISVPKFKTHALMVFTGAVKNLYGCIPGRRKVAYHLQVGDNIEMFAQVLVDLLRAVRPGLSIMDGITGMDGQGPSCGRKRNLGLIMASADPVALDAVSCMAAGIDPLSVPVLRLAAEQGLGVADPADIDVVGLHVKDVLIPDFQLSPREDLVNQMPKFLYRMLQNQLVHRPTFLHEKCTGCRSCAKMCPVSAISGKGKQLEFDYTSCIRCYCCQEVCHFEAIRLRSGFLRSSIDALRSIRRRK